MNNILIIWLVTMIINVLFLSYKIKTHQPTKKRFEEGGTQVLTVMLIFTFIFSPILVFATIACAILEILHPYFVKRVEKDKIVLIQEIEKRIKEVDDSSYTESVKNELRTPLTKMLERANKVDSD